MTRQQQSTHRPRSQARLKREQALPHTSAAEDAKAKFGRQDNPFPAHKALPIRLRLVGRTSRSHYCWRAAAGTQHCGAQGPHVYIAALCGDFFSSRGIATKCHK